MTRNSTSIWLLICAFVLGPPSGRPVQMQAERFALLKGTEIILLNDSETELASLTSDKRAKISLRWVPGGRRLSYEVKDNGDAMGRLVVIDLKGEILKEI